MSDDPRRTPDIWEEIVACRRRGEAAALATIVSTLGSTPGKDPMKMLVRGDGTFVGSVGGGCLEAEVWETAREVMQSLRPTTLAFSLNEQDYPDSGLICGGRVTIFIEPLTRPALHVFGAGHVGLATARLAAEAGFGATLYDDRDDMLAADRVGADVAVRPGEFEQTAALAVRGDLDLVIVVTRGHHDDERVLEALAATGRRPRFLGMIGSRAKRKLLTERLASRGVPAEWLEALVSPVGLDIGARTAAEIAVSIVAQLIAVTRGARAIADGPAGSHRPPGAPKAVGPDDARGSATGSRRAASP